MQSDAALLLSRFRGAFIGATLGKIWALHVASFPQKNLWCLERHLYFRELQATNPFGNSRVVEEISKNLKSGKRTRVEIRS